MLVIGVLIAVFVPQIPAIMNWYRVHLSKVYMSQLSFGIDEYKRIYGAYPEDTLYWDADASRLCVGQGTTVYTNEGYESLYLALQGPDASGWGPTQDEPGIKEFGPIPHSPGFVAKGITVLRLKPRFEDPFGRPICYYKARTDSQYPHITESYGVWRIRYVWYINDKAWESQRGADELPYGYGVNIMYTVGRVHWAARLTRSTVGDQRFPHNPKTYVLWMAGSDQQFGYWSWSDEHKGFVADEDPDDDGLTDGCIGVCDDLLNCGN